MSATLPGRPSWAVLTAVAAMTLLGFFVFPGHTFLYSDTQIYIPMLERLWDSSLYANDPVATRPHVTYTIYDETALALRRALGGDFQRALTAQQLLFRFCGILGAWLLASALGMGIGMALVTASVYALGATIAGPAVLTFEYEPVPRGYASGLLMLAIGLAAQGRLVPAAVAGGFAFLYHPPTTWPVLAVLSLLSVKRREWKPAGVLAATAAVAYLLARLQIGQAEPQVFFSTITPDLEKLQRLRGAYNWISIWGEQWIRHYEFLFAAAMAAGWRIRPHATPNARWFLFGLPVLGILGLPLSHALLEGMKWSLIPQFQPARAAAFLVAIAGIACTASGIHAVRAGRRCESLLWFAVALSIPIQVESLRVLLPDLRQLIMAKRAALLWGLAGLFAAAAAFDLKKRAFAAPLIAASLILPAVLIPSWSEVKNYPNLEFAEFDEVVSWARSSTPAGAVFLFPDSGKEPHPSIFRARALRAVYVDWKAGGQVNLLREFGLNWWKRWQEAIERKFDPGRAAEYAALGIDYLIVKPENEIPGKTPEFRNARYVAFKIR
jgi:hypothetical protein